MGQVNERWSQYKLQRGQSATRVFDCTYFETLTDAEAALYDEVDYGDEHPLDSTIKVAQGGITWEIVAPSRHWVATVQYSSPDGGGDTSQIEKLLAEKWRFKFDWVIEKGDSDRTATGVAVVNSAGDPFDRGITRSEYSGRITMWRWELGTDVLGKNSAYKNHTNSDAVMLPIVGSANPGELLLVSIAYADEIQAGAGKPVKVIYTMDARPLVTVDSGTIHGFYERKMDLGTRGYTASGSKARFRFKSSPGSSDGGQLVDTSIRLKGDGTVWESACYDLGGTDPNPTVIIPAIKKETTTDAVFLHYDPTDGEIAFSGLGIGANL